MQKEKKNPESRKEIGWKSFGLECYDCREEIRVRIPLSVYNRKKRYLGKARLRLKDLPVIGSLNMNRPYPELSATLIDLEISDGHGIATFSISAGVVLRLLSPKVRTSSRAKPGECMTCGVVRVVESEDD